MTQYTIGNILKNIIQYNSSTRQNVKYKNMNKVIEEKRNKIIFLCLANFMKTAQSESIHLRLFWRDNRFTSLFVSVSNSNKNLINTPSMLVVIVSEERPFWRLIVVIE